MRYIIRMLIFSITLLSLLIMPSNVYAWGPLTHIYLGSEILSLVSVIPPAVYSVITKYKEDFLYGNIIADVVIGKKYLPPDKNVHGWDFGFNLLDSAVTSQQKAFVYGYLAHLAADTVAHEQLTHEKRDIGHTIYELKADSILHKKYWLMAVTIKKSVQRRNDEFLGNSFEKMFLSYRTFKRIFKSITFISLFTTESINNLVEKYTGIMTVPDDEYIKELRHLSLGRAVDILKYGRASEVTAINPSGKLSKEPSRPVLRRRLSKTKSVYQI